MEHPIPVVTHFRQLRTGVLFPSGNTLTETQGPAPRRALSFQRSRTQNQPTTKTYQHEHQTDSRFFKSLPGTNGKEHGLMQWVIIFFVAMYLICTCHNEEQTTKEAKAAEEARIEREVERRVEIESKKLADRDALLTP